MYYNKFITVKTNRYYYIIIVYDEIIVYYNMMVVLRMRVRPTVGTTIHF